MGLLSSSDQLIASTHRLRKLSELRKSWKPFWQPSLGAYFLRTLILRTLILRTIRTLVRDAYARDMHESGLLESLESSHGKLAIHRGGLSAVPIARLSNSVTPVSILLLT